MYNIYANQDENDDQLQFYTLQPCQHIVCEECLQSYLHQLAIDQNINFICPAHDCQTPLNRSLSLQFLSHHVYNNGYVKLIKDNCRSIIENQSIKVKSIIPCKKCNRNLLLVNDDDDGTTVSRYSRDPLFIHCICGNNFCSDCECTYNHLPLMCQGEISQYNRFLNYFLIDEDASRLTTKNLQITGVRCPRCRRITERISGCNHMICSCGCRYCYGCGQALDRNYHSCGTKSALETFTFNRYTESLNAADLQFSQEYTNDVLNYIGQKGHLPKGNSEDDDCDIENLTSISHKIDIMLAKCLHLRRTRRLRMKLYRMALYQTIFQSFGTTMDFQQKQSLTHYIVRNFMPIIEQIYKTFEKSAFKAALCLHSCIKKEKQSYSWYRYACDGIDALECYDSTRTSLFLPHSLTKYVTPFPFIEQQPLLLNHNSTITSLTYFIRDLQNKFNCLCKNHSR